MKRQLVLMMAAAVTASGVLTGAQGQTQPPAPAPRAVAPGQGDSKSAKVADQAFVKDAAIGGMAEVELGKLASQKASNPQVKAFGQRMVTDHGQAGEELKSLAASKQIVLSTSIDSKHQAAHDRLAKLSGAEFDRAYITEMIAGHKKVAADFNEESVSGKDSEVKAWADKTLPTVREHLRMVEELDKDLSARPIN